MQEPSIPLFNEHQMLFPWVQSSHFLIVFYLASPTNNLTHINLISALYQVQALT